MSTLARVARIAGIWTSPGRKSGRSVGHEKRLAVAGQGLEGCAHARPPKREVLFASSAHLDSVAVEPGSIRENFTIVGADVQEWPIGQRVAVGQAEFEITMVCEPCHRMDELRPGLRAELDGKRGMLGRVVTTGEVAVGDDVRLLPPQGPE
jgi:MOSC domain-containing protein YiiM